MKKVASLICVVTILTLLISPFNTTGKRVLSAPAGTDERLKDSIVLFVGSQTALVNNNEVQIDPDNADVKPVVKSSSTLVPVKFIAESLGAKVGWDGVKKEVTVSLGGKTVKMYIGNTSMTVNGAVSELEIPAEIIGDRTFIPLRKLAEALDRKVFYDSGLIIISQWENILDSRSEREAINSIISRVNTLPAVGTAEKLKELLKSAMGSRDGLMTMQKEKAVSPAAADSAVESRNTVKNESAKSMDSAAGSGVNDFSKTNVQVEGVDEADVVKTDGQYIYQVNNRRIAIAKAYPAENMEIQSILNFKDENFYPQEIYVDGDRMIVIGADHVNIVFEKGDVQTKIYPPQNRVRNTVKALVYDINDRKNIKQLREVEIEGNYVSSRKIGSALYLVSNKQMNYYIMEQGQGEVTPSYRDTALKDDFIGIDYKDIRYFPGMTESNYMTVAGIDLDKNGEGANISTYLGVGQNIYVSLQNMYVTVNSYRPIQVQPSGSVQERLPDVSMKRIRPASDINTTIYKFSLDKGKATYLNKGEVPGTVLNQFSMDEYGRYFRIATTKGDMWRNDENISKNNVYILDETLAISGKLENLAPGEKIYSVRFIGDRGYIVTFKTIDPLFVIDLKDPANPAVLGALKIPGYSDYLQPYDDKHIIGFGKDTVEMPVKDVNGNIRGTNAYYLGMKIALFDVSDVSNPVQKFSEKIGDRGTDSEVLRNHKALLFSKGKNLMAFPVTLMEVKNKPEDSRGILPMPAYGQFTFQGAYVYGIDLEKGFTLKGRITHLAEQDYAKSGNGWYGSNRNVERILYINDTLYTLSKGMYKASNISDLKEIKSLEIPEK